MTRYIKEAEANTWDCPIARTFNEGKTATCDGSACILWRWREIQASDGVFTAAVQRTMACLAQEDGKGKPASSFHKAAVAQVARDPEGYGVTTDRGYCGLGGKP